MTIGLADGWMGVNLIKGTALRRIKMVVNCITGWGVWNDRSKSKKRRNVTRVNYKKVDSKYWWFT